MPRAARSVTSDASPDSPLARLLDDIILHQRSAIRHRK
jgi:hypothetical protein